MGVGGGAACTFGAFILSSVGIIFFYDFDILTQLSAYFY
jgi:hypothetical protein